MTMKIFKAKSVKILNKVIFEYRYCPWLFVQIDKPPDDKQLAIEDDEVVNPNKNEFQYPMPKTGPPKAWLDEFGRTPGCSACSHDKLHGRVYNKTCKNRYLAWQKSQRESTEITTIDFEKQPSSLRKDLPIQIGRPDVSPAGIIPPEYLPPSMPRFEDGDDGGQYAPTTPRYSRSEAPSVADDIGDIMDVDQIGSFVDPGEQPYTFASMFSDSPEVHHSRNGTLPLLDGRQVLHPFYLPKIGEVTKYDEF